MTTRIVFRQRRATTFLFGPVFAVAAMLACHGGGSADLDAGATPDAHEGPDADESTCIGDERPTAYIYYGTAHPTYVTLLPGQEMAVGTFGFCSGTLIAPSWVLTAKHCEVTSSDTFCIGAAPDDPSSCFAVSSTQSNSGDMTLVDLGVDVRATVPDVVWIPILTEVMDDSWIGRTAEAAGYGFQEDGADGEREFVAEPLVALDDVYVTIDGQGSSGACNGDSGGPVMVMAADGTARVAGGLHYGDLNCLGQDNYSRTDVMVDWIGSFTGLPPVGEGPYPCGAITTKGRCMAGGSVAMWCGDEDTLQTKTCSDSTVCGWDTNAAGFRCITGEDPCGGVDEYGACVEGIARWCEDGVPKFRDCPSCEEACIFDASHGGAWCAPDPCEGLDYLGECDGNVARWCQDGEIHEVDCTESGETCQYIDEQLGYYCT